MDHLGLDGADRRYLGLLAENYGGGPVGVETIAAALCEARDAIEEVIEPFLLQQGLLQRTPRGRMLGHEGVAASGAGAAERPGSGGPVRGLRPDNVAQCDVFHASGLTGPLQISGVGDMSTCAEGPRWPVAGAPALRPQGSARASTEGKVPKRAR